MTIPRCEICDRPATQNLYDPPSFIAIESFPICDECAEAEYGRQMDMADSEPPPSYRGKFAELSGARP